MALIIAAMAYGIYTMEAKNRLDILIEQNRSMIELQREAITQDFTLIASDVLFLAAQGELAEAFAENDAEAFDQATQEFQTFIQSKKIYDQLRFIDTDGMERIRVNFDGKNAIVVPKEKLQNKRNRYYFSKTITKEAGEIYISPLDLNIEHGEIEVPFKPMIRIATPVTDSRGKKLGVLVANYLGEKVLEHFIRIHAANPELSQLVNSDGFWLHSNPHGLEWGFMFEDKKDISFQNTHGEAWANILAKERGHFENDQGFYCFSTVHPLNKANDMGSYDDSDIGAWKIIAFNPTADLNAMLASTKNIIAIWAGIALLLAAITSIFIATAISSRKQAEITSRIAEGRMNEAVKMAMDSIIIIDVENHILAFNRAAETTFGYRHDAVIGKDITKIIIPERFRDMHTKGIARYLESGEAPMFGRRVETIARHFDGHEFPIEISISVTNTSDKPEFIAFIRDLSEQKAATEKIRKLSQAIEQAGESIIITDCDGTIEYVNPAFCDITGYQADEIVGQNPRVLNSGEQNRRFYQEMWRTIKRGENWQGRIVDRRKDGSVFPAILNISPIFDENNNITHFIGLQQNMQEYEELEERLQQSQKMEAIGTLVGGIAHDFNNTLAGIIGNLYLLRKRAADQPEIIAKADNIETLASRASEMIHQLLAFSRRNVISKQRLYLASFMKETAKLHEVSIPENIRLDFTVKDESMYIQADANQLQQMLFNLINNARDALEGVEKPLISLSLQRFTANKQFRIQHPESTTEEFALISVADNGSGIGAEDLDNIFEPFFTTKEVGQGTGLGLSMVYGTVQSHNGFIDVTSNLGKGTRFDIYLPLIKAADETQTANLYIDTIHEGRGETILLVDDDLALIRTVREILEDMNYNVITASNGREAITTYLANHHDIKLLILDVVMPELGGAEALLEIRKINPGIPCIFTTGYDRSKVLESHGMADVESVLSKPYEIADLAQLISEKLN